MPDFQAKREPERSDRLWYVFAKKKRVHQRTCEGAFAMGGPKEVLTMSNWPKYPTLYEINTWVWLAELSLKTGKSVELGSVPSAEWDTLAKYGFDAVWLMGVWERSPAGIAIANRNQNLIEDFRRALPDFRAADNVGSPYCIRRYVVDKHLGGPEALAVARRELVKRGMKLLLDFVPRHPLARRHRNRTWPGSPIRLRARNPSRRTFQFLDLARQARPTY